jgi:ArsR family metal-binding transcriptional regulator
MLIEHYDLKVYTPPCDPGAERFSAFAELAVDISEVLPYLNATLRGATYHRSANALTWKKSGHAIAFHAMQIATSNVEWLIHSRSAGHSAGAQWPGISIWHGS